MLCGVVSFTKFLCPCVLLRDYMMLRVLHLENLKSLLHMVQESSIGKSVQESSIFSHKFVMARIRAYMMAK
jgi:hypothetical protein